MDAVDELLDGRGAIFLGQLALASGRNDVAHRRTGSVARLGLPVEHPRALGEVRAADRARGLCEAFTRGDDCWRRLHLAPEIRRVESPTKHGLMHMAQLGEGEGLSEEGMSDAAVLHPGAQSPEGVFDNGVVVESAELLEIGGTERRRVEEVPPGSMLEALGRIDRSTRQRPTPSERLADAADKRQPERCRLALLLP